MRYVSYWKKGNTDIYVADQDREARKDVGEKKKKLT